MDPGGGSADHPRRHRVRPAAWRWRNRCRRDARPGDHRDRQDRSNAEMERCSSPVGATDALIPGLWDGQARTVAGGRWLVEAGGGKASGQQDSLSGLWCGADRGNATFGEQAAEQILRGRLRRRSVVPQAPRGRTGPELPGRHGHPGKALPRSLIRRMKGPSWRCEAAALHHIEQVDPGLPVMRALPTRGGEILGRGAGDQRRTCPARLFTFLPGRMPTQYSAHG